MTKAELIAALAEYPDETTVMIRDKYRIGCELEADRLYGGTDYIKDVRVPYVVISADTLTAAMKIDG